jgi:DNA-binding NarL/FixJ family response regulator
MIAEGLTNQEIADRLGTISIDGVAKRVKHILQKLSVDNRVQASVKAAKEGLV